MSFRMHQIPYKNSKMFPDHKTQTLVQIQPNEAKMATESASRGMTSVDNGLPFRSDKSLQPPTISWIHPM